MGYLKSLGTVFIYISAFLAVITFLPGLPPETKFEEYSAVQRELDPRVGPKNRLNGAEKLFEDEVHGPEDYASYNGQLYTGVHGGYVVRLDLEENRIVPIVKFGKKCDGIWQENKCGRPLGLRFDKKGNLYVVDTYYGIFKVNVGTGDYKNVVNTSKPIEGKIPHIPNSVDVAQNGDLYWSHSSTDFALQDVIQAFTSNPSGRLIRYNAAKKKNEVLIRNIGFANGVILSDDESFVLVSDMTRLRILKYNLKGPKAGQTEVFVDGLRGPVDNLHSDGRGGFLGTTFLSIDSEHPNLFISLLPHPNIRKMLVRLLVVMELPFKLLHDIYPNTYTERLMHAIGSPCLVGLMDTMKKSTILRIDASGNIMEALISDDDMLHSISAAYAHNGYLWLGSPYLKYITRVPLKQAFPELTSSEKQFASRVKSESTKQDADSTTTKPVESKPKKISTESPTAAPTVPTAAPTPNPTTTTPKPTDAPKPSAAPKADKPTGDGKAKPSETKSTSKSENAEGKKDSAKRTAESNASSRTKEDAASGKSGKDVKVEQDAKQKAQKSQPGKVKPAEAKEEL